MRCKVLLLLKKYFLQIKIKVFSEKSNKNVSPSKPRDERKQKCDTPPGKAAAF